ncbi:serine hydrolase domain-containing protein [Actinoplanes regularis]|uniref:serine hydrolase domain-containing protein n=1 Tax=Actinoplanes regularis TaxID=52697 RepID=UPI0024A19A17|nr:serine hydrolase domain-containing protein [Actinoplanes regularis]GLW31104.1 serine hydrolase [Actinoplanes regularis]
MTIESEARRAWDELPAEELGITQRAVRTMIEMVAARGAAAQLVVLRHGRVLLDRSFGAPRDVPFLLFSAGKPLTAVLVHQLAEQGLLSLDAPVAQYWPDFEKNYKQDITVRQVLQHRSGLPYAKSLYRDALLAPDWNRSVRALAAARPHHAPGRLPAYHTLSYGFLLGELVQRVTGRPLRDVLHERVLRPLGLRDTHLSAPPRRMPMRGASGGPRALQWAANRRIAGRAVIPAATISSTARDLAVFYQALLGTGLLSADSIAGACTPSANGEVDRVLGNRIRWSEGFQLGGNENDPERARPMGRLSSRRAFGHNGSNACLGWADPDRDLVLVYLTNRLEGSPEGSPYQCELSDTLLAGCH